VAPETKPQVREIEVLLVNTTVGTAAAEIIKRTGDTHTSKMERMETQKVRIQTQAK